MDLGDVHAEREPHDLGYAQADHYRTWAEHAVTGSPDPCPRNV